MNVIDRARERIERDGWMQVGVIGVAHMDPGGECVVNALTREVVLADMVVDYETPPYLALVAEVGGTDIEAVFDFNDDPSTSLEDVLLMMKRASARLDEEEAS